MRIATSLCLIVGGVVLAGCSASPLAESDDGAPVDRIDEPLYVKSTALWAHAQAIDTCWLSGIGSQADKDAVRDEVTRTWQAYANISFAGWGACPGSGFSGVQITPGTSNVVTGGLGKQADGISDMQLDFSASPETAWTQCTTNSLNRDECIRATAVHEFGHSLGFAHEQNRPDNDGACALPPAGSYGDTLVGPFDTQSIMNYCADATTLSVGDIYGVIWSYGMAPALLSVVL